jgi:hypothetical protein
MRTFSIDKFMRQNKLSEFAESGQPNEQTTRQVDVYLASREDATPCQLVNNE